MAVMVESSIDNFTFESTFHWTKKGLNGSVILNKFVLYFSLVVVVKCY